MIEQTERYKVTHDISSVSSSDLQTSASDLVAQNIIAETPGQNWLTITLLITAGEVDCLPLFQVYTEEPLLSDDFGPGEELELDPALTVPAGETRQYPLAPVYIGRYRAALAMKDCQDGAAIKAVARRCSQEGG